jgi:hypothetical protein
MATRQPQTIRIERMLMHVPDADRAIGEVGGEGRVNCSFCSRRLPRLVPAN